MLIVTQARARKFVEADSINRFNLPFGLDHPIVLASIIKVARSLDFTPTEIWSVGSNGTINRGLQLAWPDVPANVVQVGHKMTPEQIGRAKLWEHYLPFDKPVEEEHKPPFPSVDTYDGKGWEYFNKHAKRGSLFWNIGA